MFPRLHYRLEKRLCIALGPRFNVGESSSAPIARPTGGFIVDYGFVGTLDDEIRRDPERKVELGRKMTDFVTTVRHDTDEIYGRLDDAQDDKLLMGSQLNILHRHIRAHARTARLIESEARLSHEVWCSLWMLAIQLVLRKCTRRTTRSTPATTTTTTTTPMTSAQFKAPINHGVVDALAARNADRSRNGKDSHDSRTGTVGPDVAYVMTWTNLKKRMIDKYCPKGEIKKLEVELWNLKVKVVGGEVVTMVEVVLAVRDDNHGRDGDGGVMWCVAAVEWGRRGCGGAWKLLGQNASRVLENNREQVQSSSIMSKGSRCQDKKNQSSAPTPSTIPDPVKAVEPNCVICGGAHSYQNYPATHENAYRDNIQEYVSQAATANYNQGNTDF
nr:reverse transcriptase domain-containing protein [Tanacetum cinerariifolium]